MSRNLIYLDNNATSWLDARVAAAISEVECQGLSNPSSQHRAGRKALHLLESAKESILKSIGAPVEGMSAAQIILTSGGSEANNLALHAFTHQKPGLVIVGSMEHPSLLRAAELSTLCLNPVRILPALTSGQYDLDLLATWLQDIYNGNDQDQNNRVALVSLMLANNETGVINDIARVVKLCQPHDVPVHSDIIQAAGKIEFSMRECGVSAVTVNAHKIHGPVGIGALVINCKLEPRPMIVGGGQQLEWRAGTEPVALAVGMAEALQCADEHFRLGTYAQVAQMRDAFEAQLLSALDCASINGQPDARLPQTSNIAFHGLDRQALQMALDLKGVACSTGSACSSGSSRPSATLQAMELPPAIVDGSIRFSLSRLTTPQEIEAAAAIVIKVVNRMR
jgi:cysteine desulfurase